MSEQNSLIIVLGPSGRGKSTAIRTLEPKSTVVFNTEDKPLPFKNWKDFNIYKVTSTRQMFEDLKKVKEDQSIKVVVIDSFTSWTEILAQECKKATEKDSNRFAKWNMFSDVILQLFQTLKSMNKVVFILGHPEITQDVEGATQKTLKVSGQWKGSIEKEAVIVLYALAKKEPNEAPQYFLQTQTDGSTPAKSPMGMFDTELIPNDFGFIVEKMHEYWGGEELSPSSEEPIIDPKIQRLKEALDKVELTLDIASLTNLWNNEYSEFKDNEGFITAVRSRRIEIEGAEKKASEARVAEAKKATSLKMEKSGPTGFNFEKSADEIVKNIMEEIDNKDVSDTFLLELIGTDITKQQDANKISVEQGISLFKYLKDKWIIFSNGAPFPFEEKVTI